MFILDSLFLSGFRWVLDTVRTAADAELNDDGALREQLLAAELQREMGELSDEEFAALEADLLARIRAIRARREGGEGPIAFGAAEEEGDAAVRVEATVSGDFHEPPPAAAADVLEGTVIEEAASGRRRPTSRRGRGSRPARAARRPRAPHR